MSIGRDGRKSPLSERTAAFRGEVRVSPDGRYVAVNLLESSGGCSAHLLDRDTQRLLPIRHGEPTPTSDARWTPDGRIVYHVPSAENGVDLLVAGPDRKATGEVLLKDSGLLRGTEFTPDGRFVLGEFLADKQYAICVVDLEGSREPVPLVPGGSRAALSPDGAWLAYVKLGTVATQQVFVRRFDPTNPASSTEVQVSRAGGLHPFWSPDGSELCFIAVSGGHVMAASFEPAAQPPFSEPETLVDTRKLGKLKGDTSTAREIDVLPDGRLVYVGKPVERMPSHLDVTINWLDELRASVPAD
jgi:Tol biopolymer transport system component